ncbi:hypothetical protein BH11VER1_BH11VER1_00090 [soil metagenome]
MLNSSPNVWLDYYCFTATFLLLIQQYWKSSRDPDAGHGVARMDCLRS